MNWWHHLNIFKILTRLIQNHPNLFADTANKRLSLICVSFFSSSPENKCDCARKPLLSVFKPMQRLQRHKTEATKPGNGITSTTGKSDWMWALWISRPWYTRIISWTWNAKKSMKACNQEASQNISESLSIFLNMDLLEKARNTQQGYFPLYHFVVRNWAGGRGSPFSEMCIFSACGHCRWWRSLPDADDVDVNFPKNPFCRDALASWSCADASSRGCCFEEPWRTLKDLEGPWRYRFPSGPSGVCMG